MPRCDSLPGMVSSMTSGAMPPAPEMRDWLPEIVAAIEAGEPQVLVSVVQARGSVPRDAGARLWVGAGQVTDTIGGGRLEWEAVARARAWLTRGGITACLENDAEADQLRGREALDATARRELVRFPLGPRLGQCCGGAVWLLFEWLDGADLPWLRQACDALRDDHCLVRRVFFDDGRVQWQADGAVHAPGWDAGQRCLTDAFGQARPLVVVCGAGHVGRAIVNLLATLPFRVLWLDARDTGWPDQVPGSVQCRVADEHDIPDLPDDACWLVLTHDHALDLRLVDAILTHRHFRFLGMIGSATKAARFRSRLARRHPPEMVARLQCPIGTLPVRSKLPAVIAVSVVGQLLQLADSW